jgi:aminoacrylate hydrolase
VPHLTLPDGDQLRYEVHGSGAPLMMVSGLGGTAGFWAQHLDALTARYQVILHDHRGTGRSSASEIDYSVDQMAGDVIALMDALEIERAHLIGHSTGGAIGQTIALDHAARLHNLVLSATWAGKDPYFELLFASRKRILREFGPEEYLRSILMIAYPAEWVRDNWQLVANSDPADVIARVPNLHCGLSRIDAICAYDRRAELANIEARTLVICARDDMITPAYLSDELVAAIPGATAHFLDTGGHFYTNARPADFIAAVMDFLP